MNILKTTLKNTIITLLSRQISQREIHRLTGADRKTIRRLAREMARLDSNSSMATGSAETANENPPPRPPGPPESLPPVAERAHSACEAHRTWIEEQVRLGRNAQAIYQELVDRWSFTHRYNSVKRFCRGLKTQAPEQFDRLEFLPGEEAQVDYGEGAKTVSEETGKYKKPRLFVMTLRYSRKSFRKVVWKSSQEVWSKLHEEAFRFFGGVPQYVVLDNLKEGVAEPNLYEPRLNPVYQAMLSHYGVMADPARVRDPNRKGTVENAIQHTQGTALKGRRFSSLEEQNAYLQEWEEKWASPRIHGRAKRQVQEMYLEEKPHLQPLPTKPFLVFREESRTVQDDGTIQIDNSWYAARPALIGSQIRVRIYDLQIVLLDPKTLQVLRRHPRAAKKGELRLPDDERIYNPSRQTHAILQQAKQIGPKTDALCLKMFENDGRSGHRRIRGIVGLVRKHPAYRVEQACAQALSQGMTSYRSILQRVEELGRQESLKHGESADAKDRSQTPLTQTHELIRDPQEYFDFWNHFSRQGKSVH